MDHELLRMVWTQTWQVSLLILAVAGLGRLCGRNHPHFAHALWVVVLVKAVTPPLWTSSASVFSRLQPPPEPPEFESPEIPPEPVIEEPVEPPIAVSRFDPALFENAPIIPAEQKPALPPPMPEAEFLRVADVPKVEVKPAERSLESSETATSQPIWSRVLLIVWAVGALGSFVLAWFRWLLCKRAIRRAEEVHDAGLQELLQSLARRIGLRRKVRLIISKSRIGPAVWGVFRPVVLIPYQVIQGKRPADLEPILAHELIHVRRGDLWVGWLGVLVQAVWWFHPLVWWAGRLIKREAERCCDEEVVAELGMKPARYARALLDVLEQKQTLKPVPVLPGVKPVEVTQKRLERIMLLRHGCRKRTPWWCYLVMLLTAATTLPGAAFVAQAKGKEERATKSVESSKLITRHFKVGDLLEKIKAEHTLEDDAKARSALALQLRALVDDVWQKTPVLFNAKEAGTPSLSIKGNRLTVRHSAEVQKQIAKELAWLKEHGFAEVMIEARLLTAKRDLLKDLAIQWMNISPEIQSSVDKTGPMKFSIISDAESKKLVDIVQRHPQTNLLMCPKVRVFNGREATIKDVTEHPVLIPESKGGPRIEFISEGLTLKFRPILEDSKIRLASEIELSDVKWDGIATLPPRKDKSGESPKVQAPEFATMGINTELQVPDGGTVLLGGMTPINQTKEDEELFILIRVSSVNTTKNGAGRSLEKSERFADLPKDTQVHVVGCYRAKDDERLNVEVHATGKPMVVVLSSYFGADWNLRIADGADVRGVILSGYFEQSLSQLGPKAIPVIKRTYFPIWKGITPDEKHARVDGCFSVWSPTSDDFPKMIRLIAEMTGRTPATFQGAYDGKPFEIDGTRGKDDLAQATNHWKKAFDFAESGRLLFGMGADHDAKDTQKAALLYFEADWCGPCRQMTPIVSRFKRQGYPVQSVDVDKQRELAQRFNVKSLPTFLLVVDGKERQRLVGVTPEDQLRRLLAEIPANSNPPVESHPSEATPHSTLPYQGQPLIGTGVNSDAGVTGSIVIDERNFDIEKIEPPTDEEVLKALDNPSKEGVPAKAKVQRKNVKIVKERIANAIHPVRNYPMIGRAQLIATQFKCTVHYDKVVSSSYPIPFEHTDQVSTVVYIDKSYLVRADEEAKTLPAPPKPWTRDDRAPTAAKLLKDSAVVEAILLDRLRTQRQIKSSEGTLTVKAVKGDTLIEPTLESTRKDSAPTKVQAKSATLEFDPQNKLVVVNLVDGHGKSADGSSQLYFAEMEAAFAIPEDLSVDGKPEAKSPVEPAAYLKDDVQYLPPARVHGGVTKEDAQKTAEFANLVNEFNELFEKKNYQDAEKLAHKAKELFPENPTAEVMFWKSRFARRMALNERIENGPSSEDFQRPRAIEKHAESEQKIEAALKRSTTMKFEKAPLSDVAKHLATQHGIDVVLDDLGLSEEGITADQPVTINVDGIKLSSALNLLLKPLRLNYHIEDEVLKITSQTRIDLKSVTVRTYPVADLVVPLPRMSTVDLRTKPVLVKPESGKNERLVPPARAKSSKEPGKEKAWNFEGRIPPKAADQLTVDFDDLTKLITSSVEPDTWAEAGGIGSIRGYETTLSLVIRQSDRVHEQVADVLEQLRKLQDVQVSLQAQTIEVADALDSELLKSLKAGKPVTLNRDELSEFVKTATKGGNLPNITSQPKVTIFNGQTLSVILPAADADGMKLEVSPVSTADRRFVRLQVALSSDPAEGQDHLSQHHLKDGHSLLVDVTKYTAASADRDHVVTWFDKSGKRRLLLITPTIIVQEEEEELLGVPSAEKKSGPVVTVAPRIIVQEEEEELLRIPAEK